MANQYNGTDGNDILNAAELKLPDFTNIYAGAGDDEIIIGVALALGQRGNDTITGYSAYSIATYWDSPSQIFVNLKQQTASDGFGTTDKLVNIHQVHGSSYSDTMIGSETNDLFFTGCPAPLLCTSDLAVF